MVDGKNAYLALDEEIGRMMAGERPKTFALKDT